MADHTPGPWRMGSPSQFGVHNPNIIQTADGEGIASVLGMPLHTKLEEIDGRWAEGIANARLIALAPTMLHELYAAAAQIEALGGDASTQRTVIAQAKGGCNG